MAFTLDNFVRSILAVDAAIGDNSLVVALAAPPLRDPPAASADAPGILILQDQPTAPTKIEIVTYTGVSIVGTQVTLTGVTRGLEGTSPQAWPAGTQTFSGTTVAVLAQFATAAALTAVAASIPTSPSDIGAQPAGNYVLTSVTVNGKPLTGNINLTAGDVGAATAAQGALAATAVQPGSTPSFASVSVTAASGIIMDNTAQGFAGALWRLDSQNVYLLLTDPGAGATSFNSLRPLTVNTATGAITFADVTANSLTTTGNVTAGGLLTGTFVTATGATLCLRPTGNGTVILRPRFQDSSYDTAVDSNGNMTVKGSVTATAITAGGGKALTKITVSSAAPGTLADGELYLQY